MSWLKVSAIVATLGTLGLYRGLVHLLSGGSWIEGLPEGFKALSKAGSLGLSVFAWLVLVLLIVAHLGLRYTAFGRSMFAVGDNRDGARLIGFALIWIALALFAGEGLLRSTAASANKIAEPD